MSPGNPRVYLIDASIYVFRAWFSVPDRLARELTGIAIDPVLEVTGQDLQRHRVSPEDVASVCQEIGLGLATQTRLLKAIDLQGAPVPEIHDRFSPSWIEGRGEES